MSTQMTRWGRRLLIWWKRDQFDRDLIDELEMHRELKRAELVGRGVDRETAAHEAGRSLGSTALALDHARDVWAVRWLRDLALDVSLAVRLLTKHRMLATAAVVALALGIGATTTIFTFVNTTLFKDLPFDEPRAIMAVGTTSIRTERSRASGPQPRGVSYPDFEDWRAATRTFESLAADAPATVNLGDVEFASERTRGSYVTSNLFGLLRVVPTLGRGFRLDDDRADLIPVVLGHDLWQRRYRGDEHAIGRPVRVNGAAGVIVGVMPPAFRYPGTAELWLPLAVHPTLARTDRASRTLNVTGRLVRGVSREQALAELTGLTETLERTYPDANGGIRPTLAPPFEALRWSTLPSLSMLLAAATFVLLIGCGNVATLLLARAAMRHREMAVRVTLGATKGRLVRQLLVESLLLATPACLGGLAVAHLGVRWFGVVFDAVEIGAPTTATTPYWVDLSFDFRVFAFGLAMGLLSTVGGGVIPALVVSRTTTHQSMKDDGPGITAGQQVRRWSDALVVLQLALTVLLLSGTALLLRSYVSRSRINIVADASLNSARLVLPTTGYRTPEDRQDFMRRLEARLLGDPTLTSVGFGSDIPFAPLGRLTRTVSLEPGRAGEPAREAAVPFVRAGRGYMRTLGLPVLRGRSLTDDDVDRANAVAVVTERLAQRFWAGVDPIGRRLQLKPLATTNAAPSLTVVGVVPSLPYVGPDPEGTDALVFVPWTVGDPAPATITVLARGRFDHAVTYPALREHVRALDPDLALFATQSLDEAVARTRFPTKVIGSLIGALAAIAFVLSTVGLAAITAHGVAQRTRELGIRMALGAQASDLRWAFLRRTLWRLAFGVAVGLGASLALSPSLSAFLYGISPRDPLAIAAAASLVSLVTVLATLGPVRRATKLTPALALRHD